MNAHVWPHEDRKAEAEKLWLAGVPVPDIAYAVGAPSRASVCAAMGFRGLPNHPSASILQKDWPEERTNELRRLVEAGTSRDEMRTLLKCGPGTLRNKIEELKLVCKERRRGKPPTIWSDEMLVVMRNHHAAGVSMKESARILGVGKTTVETRRKAEGLVSRASSGFRPARPRRAASRVEGLAGGHEIKRPPGQPAQAFVPRIVPVESLRLPMGEMGKFQCRYATDEDADGYLFCGQETRIENGDPKKRYCIAHFHLSINGTYDATRISPSKRDGGFKLFRQGGGR